MSKLDETAVQTLRSQVRGELIRQGDGAYDEARKVYNGMIDRRPALIARCVDAADVIACVNFAREQKLPLAVRGGGHSGPGLGVVDAGLVIDLSRMRGIRVDPAARTVRVEGGAKWGDVDHATHPFGLATPSGFIASTGVGGLTLGGGIGYLSRTHGLTLDNLLSVDMVLADGRFVMANAKENPDLYWAVRGGGGNFGVVTSFEYRLHPISTVYGGPMIWPLEKSGEVLKFWKDFILEAPEDINGWFAYLTVPPAAAVPRAVPGQEDVRRRLVLHRPAGQGRGALQEDPRLRAAGHRLRRADSIADAAGNVRRALPRRPAVVLEGRLLPRLLRQGHRPARQVRRRSCRRSTRRCTSTRSTAPRIVPARAIRRSASATPTSRRSSSAWTRTRPTTSA